METVGGQAVIEGVMMRNKEHYAVAVRLKDGSIKVHKEQSSTFPKIYQKPFIRGIIGLYYALYDGMRALIWSSNQQLETEEQLSKWEIIGTIGLSLLFSIFFLKLYKISNFIPILKFYNPNSLSSSSHNSYVI